jgi:hypothetical protein
MLRFFAEFILSGRSRCFAEPVLRMRFFALLRMTDEGLSMTSEG